MEMASTYLASDDDVRYAVVRDAIIPAFVVHVHSEPFVRKDALAFSLLNRRHWRVRTTEATTSRGNVRVRAARKEGFVFEMLVRRGVNEMQFPL